MRTKCIALLITLALMSISQSAGSNEPKTKEALKAANAWISAVDAGKYVESWKQSSPIFKNAIKETQWDKALAASRTPLGPVLSRKIVSQTYTTSLPGLPAGEYVVIQYETSFKNKTPALETVTPSLGKDGIWRVSGYYIK